MDTADQSKTTTRVTILNQTYSVVSTGGTGEDARALAQTVDDLMSTIARRAGNLDSTRAAVLACLHLADRLQTAERELNTLRQSVSHKSRDFALLLDQAFPVENE